MGGWGDVASCLNPGGCLLQSLVGWGFEENVGLAEECQWRQSMMVCAPVSMVHRCECSRGHSWRCSVSCCCCCRCFCSCDGFLPRDSLAHGTYMGRGVVGVGVDTGVDTGVDRVGVDDSTLVEDNRDLFLLRWVPCPSFLETSISLSSRTHRCNLGNWIVFLGTGSRGGRVEVGVSDLGVLKSQGSGSYGSLCIQSRRRRRRLERGTVGPVGPHGLCRR